MKIEFIEYILILLIVFIQVLVFYRTNKNIAVLQSIIPPIDSLKIVKLFIPLEDIQSKPINDILDNAYKYRTFTQAKPVIVLVDEPADLDEESIGTLSDFQAEHKNEQQADIESTVIVEVQAIGSVDSESDVFRKIRYAINTYLIRNRVSSIEFDLVKDIVERNTTKVEEDINLTLSIPLYLGLMGTMLGIVIGLFNMSDLTGTLSGKAGDAQLGNGIAILLGGVKVAMIASFTGLLLTIVNSGWYLKGSKSKLETLKNDFYTFFQTELLPIVNQSFGSTIQSLQTNLLKFNDEFGVNLKRLNGIFDRNYETLRLQESILSQIDKTKAAEMTKMNLKVLGELTNSVREFERFNGTFHNVNEFINDTKALTFGIKAVLERTSKIESIGDNLERRLEESRILIDFLQSHFKELEARKLLIRNTVIDVDASISTALQELKAHTQDSIAKVKEFSIEEAEALKKALSESKNNLGNLAYLEKINQDVHQFKMSSASQTERLRGQVDELNKKLEKSITILEEIEQKGFTRAASSVWKSISGRFRKSHSN